MAGHSIPFFYTRIIVSSSAYSIYKSRFPIATTHAGYHMTIVFRCSRFAHHYSGNHIRFLFLVLLRCFSSDRLPLYPMYSNKDVSHINLTNGFPHSETSGSSLDWQLPKAYRSLLRLSSPLNAKASPICPFQLSKFVD